MYLGFNPLAKLRNYFSLVQQCNSTDIKLTSHQRQAKTKRKTSESYNDLFNAEKETTNIVRQTYRSFLKQEVKKQTNNKNKQATQGNMAQSKI